MNAPVSPFFVAPHDEGSEGVDYLGLRAINLSMMNTLLPGINNVVSLIRPFSLMSWICWRYANSVRESNGVAHPDDFRRFREKVETLWVWSHVERDDGAGLPGNQQFDGGSESLTFQFKPFQRTASLLDAAMYGPAMKTQNGLGFLYPVEGFFKATPAGEALAKGLDASLRKVLKPAQYEFVASTTETRVRREDLDDLVAGWAADTPTGEERAAFRKQLYDADEVGSPHPKGIRSTMLHFVLATAREHGPLTSSDVRRHMACSPLPEELTLHPSAPTFRYGQLAWRLLQTRQGQRLGLEGLFGWMERCLIHQDARSVDDLVEQTIDAMRRDSNGAEVDDEFIRHGYEFYRQGTAGIDELFFRGEQDARGNPFLLMEKLEEAARDRATGSCLALTSVAVLLQCAALVDAFRNEEFSAARVDDGPLFRIPLGHWGAMVRNHLKLPLRDFLRKVFETFLISQHLGVAASRSRDERSRMRISIEDRGLTSLLSSANKVLVPSRTPDRLATAMALMANSGLLKADATLRRGGALVTYSIA
jgi:hypothetical protein